MPETISITCPEGGVFDAYVTSPAGTGAAPAILIGPSIFGVTDGLKQTLDRYASRGFHAVAADPFWRTHPGPLEQPDDMAAARQRSSEWKVEQGLSDMRATLAAIATLPNWNGKFAVLGFCFGGIHAMLGLTRLGADASVAFHGVQMQNHLDGAERITKPYSFHFAEDDPVVPLDDVERVRRALPADGGEVHVYPGTGHGFAQVEAAKFHPEAAALAEQRAFAVLEQLK
jgi:carboxymethylenebutenolidase